MQRIRFKKFSLIIILVIITCSCARSTVLLRGDEAQEYLARNDHLIAPGYYTFGAVRNRQVKVIMVAVFNRDRGEKNDGNFQFLKREKSMGYHSSSNPFNVILLNSTDGERGIEPTNETLGEIRKNNLSPIIILNSEGEEEAVVYQTAGQKLAAFVRPNGDVRLEFGRRIQSEGDIIYSFNIGQTLKSSKKIPPKRTKKKEKEEMSEIKVGDLVRWESGSKIRVGVVKETNPDGTSIINVPTTDGSREEKIKSERLEVITSTIESDND